MTDEPAHESSTTSEVPASTKLEVGDAGADKKLPTADDVRGILKDECRCHMVEVMQANPDCPKHGRDAPGWSDDDQGWWERFDKGDTTLMRDTPPSDDVGHGACRHLRVRQADLGGWLCLDCGGDATADVTGRRNMTCELCGWQGEAQRGEPCPECRVWGELVPTERSLRVLRRPAPGGTDGPVERARASAARRWPTMWADAEDLQRTEQAILDAFPNDPEITWHVVHRVLMVAAELHHPSTDSAGDTP